MNKWEVIDELLGRIKELEREYDERDNEVYGDRVELAGKISAFHTALHFIRRIV